MPQTPSAIPRLSSRPVSQAVVKPLSQPTNDQAKAFASLLGVETLTKAKKRSASSAADAQDDPAPSQGASSETGASNQPNSSQSSPISVPTGALSSYVQLSSAEKRVSATSVTASAASADETGIAKHSPLSSADRRVSATSVTASAASVDETGAAKHVPLSSAERRVSTTSIAASGASAEDTGIAKTWRAPGSATGAETDSAWQLSDSAVVVRSETHFVPEATAGNAAPSLTATQKPPKNKAEAAGHAAPASLRQQIAAEPPMPDGDPAAESPAGSVPNSGSSVAPSRSRGATSDGSAGDTASHRDQSASPATTTPAEAQQTLEAGASVASGAGSSSPAQQIFDGIQRTVSSSSASQVSTDGVQTTLDGQQPLKTITLTLSPPSLGNVAVELSLKNGKLGIQLQAQEPGTVQLLRQDGALEKLLEFRRLFRPKPVGATGSADTSACPDSSSGAEPTKLLRPVQLQRQRPAAGKLTKLQRAINQWAPGARARKWTH